MEAIEARARGAMDDAARRVAADARVATAREVAAALEAGRAELDREAATLKAREASSASLEASLRVRRRSRRRRRDASPPTPKHI